MPVFLLVLLTNATFRNFTDVNPSVALETDSIYAQAVETEEVQGAPL